LALAIPRRKAQLLFIDDNGKPITYLSKTLGKSQEAKSNGLYVGRTKGIIYHFQQFSKAGNQHIKLFLNLLQEIVGNFTNNL
jgi:hypothetical protein